MQSREHVPHHHSERLAAVAFAVPAVVAVAVPTTAHVSTADEAIDVVAGAREPEVPPPKPKLKPPPGASTIVG